MAALFLFAQLQRDPIRRGGLPQKPGGRSPLRVLRELRPDLPQRFQGQ